MRHNGRALRVLDSHANDFPATLNHSEDWLIVRVASRSAFYASLAATSATTDIGFVHFNWRWPFKGFYVFGHEFVPDFLRDAVRGLVGNTKLALKLLRGYPAASACHQIHRIEPKVQGRRRLVKDGSGSRGHVLSASLTRPSLTLLRVLVTLKLTLDFALRTGRADTIIGVPLTPQKVKAGVVVRELFHKFHKRILLLRRLRSFWLFS